MPNSKIIRTSPEAQGISQWTPPSGTLGELVLSATERAAALSGQDKQLARAAASRRSAASFETALRQPLVAVIAEIKRASPSKGDLNPGISAAVQADLFERGGAAALSVLTEPHRFRGREADIGEALAACRLPILKKDFHVAEVQLTEAKALGASAALIIVRALSPARLIAMAAFARELGLEILFEIRDEAELERALDAGARMIGVNNRNLETLVVDPGTVARMVPLIPEGIVAVAESGYLSAADVEGAARAGADAVLVGSVLSMADDPTQAVRALSTIARNRDLR